LIIAVGPPRRQALATRRNANTNINPDACPEFPRGFNAYLNAIGMMPFIEVGQ
jgi:hypothetical protein